MQNNKDIQIRDPFIFTNKRDGKYYMYGSTDKNIWSEGTGFDVYVGEDLNHWEGPYTVFKPNEDFYSEQQFWAPEVHEYNGNYYMFATFFRKDNNHRGTAILRSDRLLGPFEPHSEGPVTPAEWHSLDGTFYRDEDGQPWMVFCHEWMQVGDGEICAMRLSEDLKEAVGKPIVLFRASEAPWPTPLELPPNFPNPELKSRENFITDGTFMYKASNGELLMLWASFVNNVYAQGISRSTSGVITGPWVHDAAPIYNNDGGHAMIFRTFEENLMLTLHSPNITPEERPIIIPMVEEDGNITLEQVSAVVRQDDERDESEELTMTFDENSRLGDLLTNEAAAAVLEKHLPGISMNPTANMGKAFTLKQLVRIPQANLTDEKIMEIAADLAGIER
ncbi:glycoside hydrolase family 43 protein [Paenibacillus prosopidis]|uniref:Glycosyl hydrolase family 43 n=1 Tax=Paenibacillus prosopidis TaxID=630520 RepID=A0A368VSR6_9BACL|nr:glycosyl hydrolase family 43 [Paenibacillus prosopidis]